MIYPCVLDTSVASFLVNKNPLIALYRPHITGATPVLCFQTVGEMRYGSLKAEWGQERNHRLEQFLQDTDIIHSSEALTRLWAEIMRESRRIGKRLEAADAWIAATALLLGAPLLTHDKDFDAQACPSIAIVCYADQPPTQ